MNLLCQKYNAMAEHLDWLSQLLEQEVSLEPCFLLFHLQEHPVHTQLSMSTLLQLAGARASFRRRSGKQVSFQQLPEAHLNQGMQLL